ncbi:MAG: GGDEF domain-containing protein [Candidatus Pacebacteria bacterium]|nr:GGDEF domain-containing protein [Candidatus Paceibacterota bacterium]
MVMKEKLTEKIARLEEEVKILRRDAIHDYLTGLKTRAYFEKVLELYFVKKEDSQRKTCPLVEEVSLIFFDIDNFKKINDTYGHSTGDSVLKEISKIILENIRENDIAARWGGEEIVVCLPGAIKEDASIKAEIIRKKILKNPIENIPVTVSAGVSSKDSCDPIDELFREADEALYEAKRSGKNKVVCAPAKNRTWI